MSKHADENVLVIPRGLFDQLGAFEGFNTDTSRYLPTMLDPANNFFLRRDLAEVDPTHKQIIPYAVFHYEDRVLHYFRGGGSGEKRLASKGSIGIGGHINDTDFQASSLDRDTYSVGIEREINEELNIDGTFEQKIIGLLNDESSDVGQVHLGVVHLVTLHSDSVTSAEENITDLTLLSREQLEQNRDRLETWSKICLDHLSPFIWETDS